MGTYTHGTYSPAIGETGWSDEVNATLSETALARVDVTRPTYGADPTGLTDSTAAINAAILDCKRTYASSAGPEGYCYIPAGRFRINGTINAIEGVSIVGSGPGSVLMPFNGSNPVITMAPNENTPGAGVFDLTIGPPLEAMYTSGHGSGYYTDASIATTGTGHGIYVDRGTRKVFRNVTFNALWGTSAWCIYLDSHLEGHIENCNVLGAQGGGFYLGGTVNPSNASVVRDCVMSNGGNGDLGAVWIASTGVLMSGCVIEGWRGDFGLRLKPVTASNIGGFTGINNWFEDNSGISFEVENADDCTMIGSGFTPRSGTPPDEGIRVTTAQNLNLINCALGYGAASFHSNVSGGSHPTTVKMIGCTGDLPDITDMLDTNDDQLITIGCENDLGAAANGGGGLGISRGDVILGLHGPSYLQMKRRPSDFEPARPPTDSAQLFVLNNGGKTKIYAQFATGALVLIASQP